jgi:hypothetical protein
LSQLLFFVGLIFIVLGDHHRKSQEMPARADDVAKPTD